MNTTLSEYSIENLYGLYNHSLKFNDGESIAILHGPNGVGKTALLRSITYLFNSDFSSLSKIPFSRLFAKLSDNTEIIVTRKGVTKEQLLKHSQELHKISIEIKSKDKTTTSFSLNEAQLRPEFLPPWIVLSEDGSYIDERNGMLFPEEFLHQSLFGKNKQKEIRNRETATQILEKIKVHFVETNRLYRSNSDTTWKRKKEKEMVASVDECAKHLVVLISTALKDYGKKSQELDQSFPHRFISEPIAQMSLDKLKTRLNELASQLKKLRKIGLLDAEGIQPFDPESLDKVEKSKLEIMNLYVRDSEQKLAVFDNLSKRIQVLLDGLNSKFKNKNIQLNKERGLIARGPNDFDLSLSDLSSGEQHEIVLLYELLFKVAPNTLVLIDEPELSLHMTWQKSFLPELLSISREIGFSSILATHSPFIVGDRYDLLISLDTKNNNDSME